MKLERMNDRDRIKWKDKKKNKIELPFGLVHAGEISDVNKSYICPEAIECFGH